MPKTAKRRTRLDIWSDKMDKFVKEGPYTAKRYFDLCVELNRIQAKREPEIQANDSLIDIMCDNAFDIQEFEKLLIYMKDHPDVFKNAFDCGIYKPFQYGFGWFSDRHIELMASHIPDKKFRNMIERFIENDLDQMLYQRSKTTIEIAKGLRNLLK